MRFICLARFASTVVLLSTAHVTSAIATENYIQWTDGPGTFSIARGSNVAAVIVDPTDWPGVARAANDLRDDIKRVTGNEPAKQDRGSHLIVVGTLGHSPLIDGLAETGNIDVSAIKGKWESFAIQVVPHALPDADSALVIAGSDKRGTIYGIYDLSQQIGVSPWYWWADVPTAHHDNIFVKAGNTTRVRPPSNTAASS